MMNIDNHPHINILDFINLRTDALNYISNGSRLIYFENARTAIYKAMSALSPGKRSSILMPSYNCGEEVEAVIRAGFNPDFYKIDRSCQPDLNDIERRIKNDTFAIFATHFNGFPQPVKNIKELCEKYSILLIEDCAHVLKSSYNNIPLGKYGDLSVFSLRKYLPIRNGGILIVSNDDILSKSRLDGLIKKSIISDLKYYICEWYRGNFTSNIKSALGAIAYQNNNETTNCFLMQDFSKSKYHNDISPISKFLINKANFNRIVEKRRENYKYLFNSILFGEGKRCLLGDIKSDICPLYFLLEVHNPWSLGNYLFEKKSIASMVFWSFYHKCFPFQEHVESSYLKKHVLALPVHQDLELDDMEKISNAVNEYRR